MKKQLLTKTLLMAVMLLGGANFVWADKNYSQIFKYTFEDAGTFSDVWTIDAGSASQFDISGDKYIYFKQSARNATQTQTLDFSSSVTGVDDYLFSFDFAYCPLGSYQKGTGWANKILTVYAADESELFHLEADASSGAVDINVFNGSGTNIGKFTSGGRYSDPTAANVYTISLTGDSENGVVIAIKNVSTSTAVTFSDATLSASYKLVTKIVNTLQSTSNTTYYSRTIFDDVYFGEAVTGDYAGDPTLALTGFSGSSRIFTISCGATETIHYQVKEVDEVKQSGAGASAGASVNVTVPAGQKLIAWTTMGVASSSNVEITVTGGIPVLSAPTVTLSDIGTGYNKSYIVSNLTQSITEGAYNYEFQPDNVFYATSSTATSGTNISDNKFSLTAAGTYYVIVSKEGATSASTPVDNTISYLKSAGYDFTNSAILTAAWTDASGTEKWAADGDAEAYKENSVSTSSSTELFDGFTVSDAGSRLNKMHWHNGKGVQFVNGSGNFTIGLTSVPANAIIRNTYYQNGSNRYVIGNTITIGRYNKTGEKQGLVAIDVYTPDPVALAIADCKKNETSSAFATAIDEESFATAAEVYAFHTAWQIAQADAASSNDITKVIFDAAVSDFSRWNNARNNSGQQYTGAPDNKYFDAWDNSASDAKQKIYGLPAGTYTLKVATRASADVADKSKYNVWVSGGSADVSVLGNHIGNTGGVLGNGWNWTILSFTLAAKADVEIGFYSCPPTERWAGCDDWHLYKGTLSASGTITSAGWNTFSSPYALDLSTITGGTAYYASAASGSKVTLTPTGDVTVPAGEGLMIKGTAGETFTIDVAASGTAIDGNLLVGLPNGGTVTANDDNYVFGWADAADPGFYFVNNTEPTLGAGKAYLHVAGGVGSRLNIVFGDDEVTGVKEVIEVNDNSFYDLNGRKVAQPQKGLYIVNGKKVVIK